MTPDTIQSNRHDHGLLAVGNAVGRPSLDAASREIQRYGQNSSGSSATQGADSGDHIATIPAASKVDIDQVGFREGDTHPPIYIEFQPSDPRDPMSFPKRKKWVITAVACGATVIAAFTAGSYALGLDSMTRDLSTTHFRAMIGLGVYALGFGVTPLVTASFSEEFGRTPLYVVSGIGFLVMYPMIALARNIETVIVARFIQGACGSTGATMVGGTIADIWGPKERGLPMAIFSISAIASPGLGPLMAGWIEMDPHLQWKWTQWIQMMVAGAWLVTLLIFMDETRASVILTRIAQKKRKHTGDHRYRARIEDERPKLSRLIYISCTRPLYLLCTELIVASFSLWIGFAWGIYYGLIGSLPGVLRSLHHFNAGQTGTAYISLVIGSFLAFLFGFYQDKLYERHVSRRGPEARLYSACVCSIIFPIGMFIYAWSGIPHVHWIGLEVGMTVYIFATFTIYVAVFSYLADCYGPYASSALAGQSLFRNLMATAFPLSAESIYKRLDYKWANTLFGCIAVLMVPIPFALFFCGPGIRQRSKFSRAVMEEEDRAGEKEPNQVV